MLVLVVSFFISVDGSHRLGSDFIGVFI